MKVIADNFPITGVERCILEGLFDTISPDVVLELDDSLIRNIAAETEEQQLGRAHTIEKLKCLKAGLQTLNRLD